MNLLRLLWRGLRGLLLGLAALWLLFEEWGWRPLAAALGRLAAWPPVARLEARVRGSAPRIALSLFLAPAALLLPVKLMALGLFHAGRPGLGMVVIVAAKVIGTAIGGRLFVLTEPQLMQFPVFARVLVWWRETHARIAAALQRTLAWRAARRWVRAGRAWLRRGGR